MKTTFSPQQKRILTMCAVMYTATYVCRLNLSPALSGVMDALGLSMARGGMLQTVFAVIYAAGQFVNGAIVDRVNPAKYMLLGLSGSALCNIAMGLSSSYPMMLAIWSVNAAFQSMMWTPIVRLIAMYFLDDTRREQANKVIALILVAGHFLAWTISGFISAVTIWRFSFIVPGCVTMLAVLLSTKTALSLDVNRQETRKAAPRAAQEPIMHVLLATGFYMVIITSIFYGFIRDSVITWTPTILSRISGGDAVSSASFTLILPVINIAGVYLGFYLRSCGTKPRGVISVMMVLAMICGAMMMLKPGMLLTAVLLGMICAGMYGVNTILTGLIPLEYDCVGRTSLTAGMVDSFIYVGSALSGAFAGGIYETLGPNMLYGSWILTGGLSVILMHLSTRMSSAYWQKTEK